MSTVKRIDIREFREFGFLQELNRQFLHPLGLALEVQKNDDGSEQLGGVLDYRDDPEGMIFGDEFDQEKISRVGKLLAEKSITRRAKLGYVVQPK